MSMMGMRFHQTSVGQAEEIRGIMTLELMLPHASRLPRYLILSFVHDLRHLFGPNFPSYLLGVPSSRGKIFQGCKPSSAQ